MNDVLGTEDLTPVHLVEGVRLHRVGKFAKGSGTHARDGLRLSGERQERSYVHGAAEAPWTMRERLTDLRLREERDDTSKA